MLVYGCTSLVLAVASSVQVVNPIGYLKATVTQIGVPTAIIVDQPHAPLNGSFAYGSSRSQKVVSLSSCESELHSMVSCVSFAVFIKVCCEFILNEEVKQVEYTDSSSARRLACREGAGPIRHLSGKILWIQEKTQDGSVDLRQVPTAENVSGIARKVLARQRLLYLMHETGLLFIPSFENVGKEESARHQAKVGGSAQIRKIAKTVYRISLVMGLEPLGVMGQPEGCPSSGRISKWSGLWIFATVSFFTCALTVFWLGGKACMETFATEAFEHGKFHAGYGKGSVLECKVSLQTTMTMLQA
eukprot:s2640_g1.t1